MRAIWITRHGGPGVLEVRESPDPEPAAGEIRIRVRAAGLNFSELMARAGLYPDAPKPPCVVGYEASGVVDAGPRSGERVLALTRFGGHADTICVPEAQVRRIPDAMPFEHAAALPVVYLTAHHMLFRIAGLRPGATVLVHMAGGALGLAALQLCRTVQNVTVLGTASRAKHEALARYGFDALIDYRTEDYTERVRELTGGRGVDLVLDPLGGADWKKGYDLLRPAGMLVAFGFANMAAGQKRSLWRVLRNMLAVPKFAPTDLMSRNKAVAGVNVGHLWNEMDMMGGAIDKVLALYEQGRVAPVIDSAFRFDDAAAAHVRMHERKNVGKILLLP
jgi:NADPH:quinone reductase-like Zn-dependent oxidoreductase